MAENVGFATLSIIPSAKGLAANLEKQTRGDMGKAGRKAGRQYGDAVGKEAGGRLKSALQGIAAPLGGVLAGAGLVSGLKSIVSAASDAEQSIGGVQAVFGKYADQVLKDSRASAQNLGLSANAYRELVTVSSALLKNKGLTDFAEQGRNLIEIGADLAAQYGGSTREAVEALNAAMRGESDPIERYAVSLNETAVNAELARQGLSGLKGPALEQAKAQARLSILTQQTADAQGAFAREADTAAGAGQRLSAALQDRLAKAGEVTLTSVTRLANGLNQHALPALDKAGGVAADAVRAFRDLPGPIQAAAGAFVVLRGATALGITGAAGRGFTALRSGLDGVRLRAMLAGDEYRRLRTAQLTFSNGAPQFTAQAGRMNSAMGAMRTSAQGAGTALRRGLGGAMTMIGGPWGAALAIGTGLLVKHLAKQRELNAATAEFTSLLDAQTGAITKGNRELVARELTSSGATERARELGIALTDLQAAALGSDEALLRVVGAAKEGGEEGLKLLGNLKDVRDIVQDGKADWRDQADLLDKSAETTEKVSRATNDYRGSLDKAREALQKLHDKENERRNANLSAFQAETRLKQAMAQARKEAEEGARTLDASTQAGRDNRDALASLADAWNSAPENLKRADGAYESMRQRFIKVAESMGAGKDQAKNLADQLLQVPKNVAPKFSTPGMEATQRKIKRLEEQLKRAHELSTIHLQVIGPGDISRPEFGRGTGYRPYVADGTGRRGKPSSGTTNNTNIHIDKVETPDSRALLNDLERRRRLAALGGAG